MEPTRSKKVEGRSRDQSNHSILKKPVNVGGPDALPKSQRTLKLLLSAVTLTYLSLLSSVNALRMHLTGTYPQDILVITLQNLQLDDHQQIVVAFQVNIRPY